MFLSELIFKLRAGSNIRIIVAAHKNAVADAVRLWKMLANLDRQQIDGLTELAKTGAKLPLREFYLEMKRRDAETIVPDLALQRLQ